MISDAQLVYDLITRLDVSHNPGLISLIREVVDNMGGTDDPQSTTHQYVFHFNDKTWIQYSCFEQDYFEVEELYE